jgi:hypothetical protein
LADHSEAILNEYITSDFVVESYISYLKFIVQIKRKRELTHREKNNIDSLNLDSDTKEIFDKLCVIDFEQVSSETIGQLGRLKTYFDKDKNFSMMINH